MVRVSAKNVFQVLEYTIFLGLTFISILLSWEAIEKYKARDTNLKRRHEDVKEFPAITICFIPNNDMYIHGQDFHFNTYHTPQEFLNDENHEENILLQGTNLKSGFILTKIVTAYYGNCFKIDTFKKISIKSEILTISIKFKDTIQQSKLPSAVIYITSDVNSLGIARAYWFEGRLIRKVVSTNIGVSFGLIRNEFNYLEEKSGCSEDQSWYDCYAFMAESLRFEKCSSKCLAHSIRDGNQSLEYCEPKTEEWKCSNKYLRKLRNSLIIENICPRRCKIIHYDGEMIEYSFNHTNTIAFEVFFKPPYISIIYDEYLLFDLLGLISSIGGTLGIFIGISIIAVISKCFSCLLLFLNRFSSSIISSYDIENQL